MKILVPVDFTMQSDNACIYALHVAEKLSAELTLFNAFYDPFIDSDHPVEGMGGSVAIPKDYLDSIKDEAIASMNDLVDRLEAYKKEKNVVTERIHTVLTRGFPEYEILAYANSNLPDLMLMGTNASEKPGISLFGSVTAKIISNAPFPVLAVPGDSKYKGITNIMYATDFEKEDSNSIHRLLKLFSSYQPNVLCAHVHLEKEEPWTTELLNFRKTHFREEFPEGHVEFDLVEGENLLEGADYYITEKSIDIISFTTHKRNIIARLLRPSKTKKMLFHTHTPLLAFHQHE